MKKSIFSFFLVVLTMQALAWTSPVNIPDVGNARLRIAGQNAQNYLMDLTASNSSCATEEEFKEKTDKMANVFLALQADIVAICEVEENDYVLGYICDAMNSIYGEDVYTFVKDGMNASQQSGGYMPLKSGYIYRKDKVTPSGSNTSPYTTWNYKPRMRIQAFKENATGELFTLSMNHFKAKDSSADQAESVRIENANKLLAALKKINNDPDILVMGDLNATTEEEPIQLLINAGYEEQLERFDPNSYSYIYRGVKSLIDHVLANGSMADQITGAYTYHINTSGGISYKYSDHDAYVIGMNLGEKSSEGTQNIEVHPAARKLLINGQLVIEINGQIYSVSGLRIQ